MSQHITLSESNRLVELELKIERNFKTFIEVGEALSEIRDSKLYRIEHSTFEDYCKKKWGMSDRHARQIMDAAVSSAIIASKSGTVVPLPVSERRVRPLSSVAPAARPAIWKAAVASANGGQPTPKQVAHAIQAQKPAKEIHRDETGYTIPDKILTLWNRRQEVLDIQNAIAKARRMVKEAYEKLPDPLWQPVNMQAVLSELQNTKRDLDMAYPFAVCPICQGMAADKCAGCKGRGFLPKHTFNICTPPELLAIRAKSCVK